MTDFPEERRSSLNWWLGALGVAAVGLGVWAYLDRGVGPEVPDVVAETAPAAPEEETVAEATPDGPDGNDAPPPAVVRPVRMARAPARPDALPVAGSPPNDVLASVSLRNVGLGPTPGNLTWRFSPATRNKLPVRYRLLIPLSRVLAEKR